MVESDLKQQPSELTQLSTDHDESVAADDHEARLKYLDFVKVATLHFIACFASLYDYAKENSGPLKPGVQTVEDTVKTVIGPVYVKFHDVPLELLKFLDRKVESVVSEADDHVPSLVKTVSSLAYSAAQLGTEAARAVAAEVNRVGLVETATEIAKTVYTKCEPTAKELYVKYEPVAEQYAVITWHKLNELPLFAQLAHIVVPTAAYWADKYNESVTYAAQRGYALSSYLPLVPIEKIVKTFSGEDRESTQPHVSSPGVDNNHTTTTNNNNTVVVK
ncbi:hypothetical protein Scep_018650 [Stephania cephalantha]|uniref:Uncharacterized protein n=1 Tax=Stephania cephalantha TaxID=152367 RepID=A0AAP0NP09_9MAGN